MEKLDLYSPKTMSLASSGGGATKIKIQRIRNMVQEDSVERRREVVIRSLLVYLKEKEEDLFREYLDGEVQFTGEMMKIIVIRSAVMSHPASAKIVIEGTDLLKDLDVPRA